MSGQRTLGKGPTRSPAVPNSQKYSSDSTISEQSAGAGPISRAQRDSHETPRCQPPSSRASHKCHESGPGPSAAPTPLGSRHEGHGSKQLPPAAPTASGPMRPSTRAVVCSLGFFRAFEVIRHSFSILDKKEDCVSNFALVSA